MEGFDIKVKYVLTILFIAIILSVLTHVIPIFLPLPKWILLNIAGTFLVSYALGSLYGILYAGILNIVISSIGMGSGVIVYALLTQVIEAGLIGLLKFKRMKEILNLVLISFVLGIVIKPIGMLLYAIFNGGLASFMGNIINTYTNYLKTDLTLNIVTYLISSIIGYLIYKLINRVITKGKGALYYEKN